VPKGDMALVYDGTRAWVISAGDGRVLGDEEGGPLSEALPELTRSRPGAVILLPPSTAVV